jgi:MFS family permease
MIIVISALIIDTIIANIYDLVSNDVNSGLGVSLFIIISGIFCGAGLIFLFRFIRKNGTRKKASLASDKLYKLIIISQLLITALFLTMILQMVLTSQYFTIWLVIVLIVGDIPFYVTFSILTKRLFSWYRSSKRNKIVLLLGLVTASSMMASALLDTATISILSAAPMVVQTSTFETWKKSIYDFSSVSDNSELYLEVGFAFDIGDFIFLWIISAVLLYDYSHRIGKSTTYWTVIFLPIAFLLIGIYPILLGLPNADFIILDKHLILYRILATLASIASGILFCISFLILARGVRQIKEKIVADYLKIAGYGIALITLSLIVEIVLIPYPPFGIATCAALALGSYLFYLGMYSSVISISGNMALRESIKKAAINELKPFDSIGTAEMSVRLQEEVRKLVKEHSNKMIQEAEVMPYFSEEDAKKYLQEVLNELNKHRTSDK